MHSSGVTEYFTGLAGVYADHRPTYPAAAIEWIVHDLNVPINAADIGCGTGISTRLLAERGVRVIGIDPNADMLDQARRTSSHTTIEYRQGTSEQTGLDSSSIDLVVCAQAFHWFDALAALREFHRVLRPNGRLALMWNIKTPANPFSSDFVQLLQEAQQDAETRGLHVPSERDADPILGGLFTDVQRKMFTNPQQLNLDGVLGRARSASYFPKAGPKREQLEHALMRSFQRYQHEGTVSLQHETEVTLASRVDRVH